MATKSILKDIDIREKHMGRKLVNALENAKGKHSKVVEFSRACSTIKKGQIKELFRVTK